MDASKALTSFFEENLVNDFDFFLLYKDKQLLKENKYREFAQEQLKKTNKILFSIMAAVFLGLYYGITSLISYGANAELVSLVTGLFALSVMTLSVFLATKEYYSIKSSMKLFLKLLDENKL